MARALANRRFCFLRWAQVEFGTATLHVRRVKQGMPSTHPILGDELRALRRLQRELAVISGLPFILAFIIYRHVASFHSIGQF